MFDRLVVVRGGGDLGTGVAVRLRRAGFPILVLEAEKPVAVRRTVSVSEAVYDGQTRVEEFTAVAVSPPELEPWQWRGPRIPVVVDPAARLIRSQRPFAVVDAIMAKRNLGTTRDLAPCVLGLGPGFTAGTDVTAVIETNRGPDLGRVLWSGPATPNTGQPGAVEGRSGERVLRAPTSGTVRVLHDIGAIVEAGMVVAEVDGMAVPAAFRALVRGIVRDGLTVPAGSKIGDIDPRLDPGLCFRISDKALAVAGGVLEATLTVMNGTRS